MKDNGFLESAKIIIVIMILSVNLSIVTNYEINKEGLFNPSNFHDMDLKTANLNENPIFIDAKAHGVNAHNWSWAVTQSWCNGSGSQLDPYCISYLNINGMGNNNCIEIRNSNLAYFTIEHCNLYNAGNAVSSMHAANIILNNSKHGKIYSNNITGASSQFAIGLYMENCSYMNLLSNNISENKFNGIQIIHSYASNVSYNLIENNEYMGLTIEDNSQTNSIDHNLINNNYEGIGVTGSSYTWIWENTIKNSYLDGIICVDCYNIDIQFNKISHNSWCGINIKESNVIDIWGNTIDYNEYGIYLLLSDTNSIRENKIISNDNCPLMLVSSNNNNIRGNNITNNKGTIEQIDCVDNQFIDNIVFNQPEQYLLTTGIIVTIIIIISIVLFVRKRQERKTE